MKKRILIVMIAVLLIIATTFVACDAFGGNKTDNATNTNQTSDGDTSSSTDNGAQTSDGDGSSSTDNGAQTSDGDGASSANNVKTVQSVVLSKQTLSLGVGESETLVAFASPDDIEVTYVWSSTNEAVATVSAEGVVTGVAKGTAVIKVKADNVFSLCNVEVVEKVGSVTGTVTYKYNNYVGNKPDTDATVILISKKVEALDDSLALGSTYDLPEGCFSTKVDGTGKYLIDNVPVGDYVLLLISKNTNSGISNNGWLSFGGFVYYKFTEEGQKTADSFAFLHKIKNANITVEADKTLTFSHDFGITYY